MVWFLNDDGELWKMHQMGLVASHDSCTFSLCGTLHVIALSKVPKYNEHGRRNSKEQQRK